MNNLTHYRTIERNGKKSIVGFHKDNESSIVFIGDTVAIEAKYIVNTAYKQFRIGEYSVSIAISIGKITNENKDKLKGKLAI